MTTPNEPFLRRLHQRVRTASWYSPTTLLFAVIAIVAMNSAGGLATYVTGPPGEWYSSLTHPPGTPPGYIIGAAWTTIYTLTGLSLVIYTRNCSFDQLSTGLGLFLLQWVLNTTWTPLFFGLHRPDFALMNMILLIAVLAAMLRTFHRAWFLAGLLLGPYLLWLSYACYLNTGFLLLN